MKKYPLLLLFLALIAVLAPGRIALARPAQQSSNLLTNPSFERPYSSGAANGWGRWHQDTGAASKPEDCAGVYYFQPSWFDEANGSLVLDGSISQHVGNQFDTWHAGVYQTVSGLTAGTRYRFTFYGTGRATNDQYPAPSNTEVNLGIRGGIDPNGSGLWTDSDITWGGSGSPHMSGGSGNWQQFSVEATATGSSVTVFVAANLGGANQCRAHLDIWFDKAELVVVGPAPTNTSPPQPTSPPPPAVTNTPVPPTATNTPEVPPTDTPVPTETATNTPEPPKGGTICLNAFADQNANGQHDQTEGAMAGVTLTVANATQVVGQGVSSGGDPLCFQVSEVGTYQVAQTVPATLEMTTGGNTTITVAEGQMIAVEFGSRPRTEISNVTPSADNPTTAAPQATAPAGDNNPDDNSAGGSNLLVIGGMAAIILAVILLGVLLFVLLRQRA